MSQLALRFEPLVVLATVEQAPPYLRGRCTWRYDPDHGPAFTGWYSEAWDQPQRLDHPRCALEDGHTVPGMLASSPCVAGDDAAPRMAWTREHDWGRR